MTFIEIGEEYKIQEPYPGRVGQQAVRSGIVFGEVRGVRCGVAGGPAGGDHMLPLSLPARGQRARQPAGAGRSLAGVRRQETESHQKEQWRV